MQTPRLSFPPIHAPLRSRKGERWRWTLLALGALVASSGLSAAESAEPVHLEQMVITGTRTPHPLIEAPIRTQLLTSRMMGLCQASNIADAVEMVPGARVENNCQNCGTSDILLLGMEQKYSQILFDGVPLFSGLAGVYGIEQIPAGFLERIEIVKGGGSAVYGSGAVAGVINLIGRRPTSPAREFGLRFESVHGEPAWTADAWVNAVDGDGRRGLSLYGQWSRSDPVDLNDDGFSDLPRKDLRVFGLRWVEQSTLGDWTIDFNRTDEFRRGGNKFHLPDPLADISERIDTLRDALTVSLAGGRGGDIDYRLAAGASRIDRETFYGGLFGHDPDEPLLPESAPGAGDNDQGFLDRGYRTHGEVAGDQFGFTDNLVFLLDAQVGLHLADRTISVGSQYYRETIDDIVPVSPFVAEYPVAPDTATGDSVGMFIQDDWRLGESWNLVTGIRADRNSELDAWVWSPRGSVRYAPDDDLVVRATVATGFRAPQPFDEDLHIELIAGDRTRTVQTDDLREERSLSSLLSVEYSPPAAVGRLTVETTLFHTRLDGTFTNSEAAPDPETGEIRRLRYNGPDAEVGGVEINVGALPWRGARLDLGFVSQYARYREPVVVFADGDIVRSERDFLESPRHYGVAQFTLENESFGGLMIGAQYTGSMKALNERTGELNRRTEDFLVWNVTLQRDIRLFGWADATLSLGARNIFDSRQGDIEAGVDRDPYYLYGPRTPRTFFFSARTRF